MGKAGPRNSDFHLSFLLCRRCVLNYFIISAICLLFFLALGIFNRVTSLTQVPIVINNKSLPKYIHGNIILPVDSPGFALKVSVKLSPSAVYGSHNLDRSSLYDLFVMFRLIRFDVGLMSKSRVIKKKINT